MKRSLRFILRALALSALLTSACGDDDKGSESNADSGSPPSGMADGSTNVADASGGDGGNPATCPAQAPMDESTCTQSPLSCRYGTRACSCERPSPADPGKWECSGGGGMQSSCPMAEPTPGSACSEVRGECRFGGRVCDCTDDDVWACWNPADCPPAVPVERAACTTVGMSCEYPAMARGEDESECECEATGWDCGRQFCPPVKPTLGGECENGDGTCTFGGDTCECVSRMWSCWAASDCPAAPPAENAACTINGMICPYGTTGRCRCDDTSWECRGVQRASDAGVRDASVDAGGLDAGMSDAS